MAQTISADDVEYSVSAIGNTSSGDFAPYFIGSLNHGRITQKSSCLSDVSILKETDAKSQFSLGFGAEVIAGTSTSNDYERWNTKTNAWDVNPQRPAAAWLQQMYLEAKYRSLYMSAGLKEHTPALLNYELSSGDFVESGNARPIPELRGGFYDFVDLPLTNGWVQMQTQLAYGKMMDDKWNENHYNYYNGHLATNAWYTYKFFYFRSNPDQRLMVTAGMQSASIFGGKAVYYEKGNERYTNEYNSGVSAFVKMLIPVLSHDETFAPGSTIGSWDFYAQYMLDNGNELAAYFQWPFEDGSGIARRNKIDGIWGLEFKSNDDASIVKGVVLEYVDFRDQSGPIHYAPNDYNGTTVGTGVSGRDNYYNNGFYNSYAYYGVSIGTPFLKAPIYNLDGCPQFTCNRANGVHIGINGNLRYDIPYRLLFGYQRGLGTYLNPYYKARTNTSMMVECGYDISDNLALRVQLAYDHGTLRGNNFGALLSLSYHGRIIRTGR